MILYPTSMDKKYFWEILSSPNARIQADLPPEMEDMLYAIAPYTPQENPVGHLVKRQTFVHAIWTTCFEQIKNLFVKGIRQKKYFQFPKLGQYTLALK